jgi:hypothetical protein
MNLGSRLNAMLCWLADRSVVGAMTCLAALPLLSAPAAFAAGAAAVREDSLTTALPAFWRTFRRHLRSGLGAGALVGGLIGSAVTAVAWATASMTIVEQATALVVCLQASVAAAVTLVFSATVLDMGAKVSVRNVLAVVLALPRVFALVLLLFGVGAVAVGIAPILALPWLGAVVQMVSGNKLRYRRRLSQQTT